MPISGAAAEDAAAQYETENKTRTNRIPARDLLSRAQRRGRSERERGSGSMLLDGHLLMLIIVFLFLVIIAALIGVFTFELDFWSYDPESLAVSVEQHCFGADGVLGAQ